MLRLPKFFSKTLSVRLSLIVVSSMAILLMGALVVMLHYSRKVVKEEALHKASQTLEGTVQNIDNILLSVEQATGNMFYNIYTRLGQPDFVVANCRKLVEANPYIAGCAIAFKPYYYKDREYFVSYVFRTANDSLCYTDSPVIQPEIFGNRPYPEQVWFTKPMTSKEAGWINPSQGIEASVAPITTFSLPIPGNDGQPVGVISVDVSLRLLSHVVLSAKPSPNSYCTLLAGDGSFIVHPDSDKLFHQTVFTQVAQKSNTNIEQVATAMVSGETGYMPFRMNGTDYFVFFKPFERTVVPGRAMEKLDWSVGIIYPEDDIFGDYNRLIYDVLAISIIGLLLLFLLSQAIIHRQLLPLRLLTQSAQHIAQGNYNEQIPDSHQEDEIGRLQNHFQQMQKSLANNINELEQLTNTVQQRGKELRLAYEKAQQADRMKTVFLHNMTDQMIAPACIIDKDVMALCDFSHSKHGEETDQLTNEIQKQGETIAELLNHLLDVSEDEIGKEGTYETP